MPADEKLPAAQGPEIVDPANPPALYVDWVVTGGVYEGVVNVTLGSIDHSLKKSDDELARVVIASRLRFSRDFGVRIHTVLGRILGLPTATTEQPPEPSPALPKNMIN